MMTLINPKLKIIPISIFCIFNIFLYVYVYRAQYAGFSIPNRLLRPRKWQ